MQFIFFLDLPKWQDKPNPTECLEKSLLEICGEDAKIKTVGEIIEVEVDGKTATIDLNSLHTTCSDQLLHHLISSVCQKMMHTVTPVCPSTSSKQ